MIYITLDAHIHCPRCGVVHVESDGYDHKPHRKHMCKCGLIFSVTLRGVSLETPAEIQIPGNAHTKILADYE